MNIESLAWKNYLQECREYIGRPPSQEEVRVIRSAFFWAFAKGVEVGRSYQRSTGSQISNCTRSTARGSEQQNKMPGCLDALQLIWPTV